MKEYEYVSVDISGFVFAGNEEHRSIIDEYAANGYRYAGFIPTAINGHGKILTIDLIFERDKA